MKRNVLINRPVFTQREFQSGALTVLSTLFHRFTEPGVYDLFVRREGEFVHRAQVRVGDEGGQAQINLDLATLGQDPATCAPEGQPGLSLSVDGVLGFYVSQGNGRFTVSLDKLGKREKETVLDSAKVIPAGDIYALTLARAGSYQVITQVPQSRGKAEILVQSKRGQGRRGAQGTLLVVDRRGMVRPDGAQILAGQTVAFQCQVETRIQVELVKPAVVAPTPDKRRRRRTVRPPGLKAKPPNG